MLRTLSQEEARDQLGYQGACPTCVLDIFRAFCRECGEFFDYGHDGDCPAQTYSVHNGHPLQYQSDNVSELIARKL